MSMSNPSKRGICHRHYCLALWPLLYVLSLNYIFHTLSLYMPLVLSTFSFRIHAHYWQIFLHWILSKKFRICLLLSIRAFTLFMFSIKQLQQKENLALEENRQPSSQDQRQYTLIYSLGKQGTNKIFIFQNQQLSNLVHQGKLLNLIY